MKSLILSFRYGLKVFAGGLLLFINACETSENKEKEMGKIDIQGHRGARGLLPENSIPAFLKAVELGVTTLELDVCISKDMKVVVSHEPFMNHVFCLGPDGEELSEDPFETNLFKMDYQQISSFDCGSRLNPRFPDQELRAVPKPLLADVFKSVSNYCKENGLKEPRYNIEIKSNENWDNEFHPAPAVFSKIVYEQIDGVIDWTKVTIQSFDFRVVRYFKKTYPETQLALLIENDRSWEENLDNLGFDPDIYSCYYDLLTLDIIDQLHSRNIKVVPWTVNDSVRMKELVSWGVDGIITDYPNIAVDLFEAQ